MPASRNVQKRPAHGSGAVRREAMRRKRAREERLRKLRLPAAIGVAVLIATVAVLATRGGSSKAGPSPTTSATSAFGSTAQAATDAAVDGIPCETGEKLTYHVHSHLAVYVNGTQQTIPQGIGINTAKSCIYWLHTHTPDGLVHVEAPAKQDFTLGQLFDVWGQPLTTSQVATASGAVTAFVDGTAFTGDPRTIPIGDHTVVQLDVGSASPEAQPFSFPAGA